MNSILLNCFSYAFMTEKLIPSFLNRKNKSAIINVSSGASVRTVPYFNIYSAVKAFEDVFSRSLSMEYSNKIDIISLRALGVNTTGINKITSKIHKYFLRNPTVINIRECASGCLSKLGYEDLTYGHYRHFYTTYIFFYVPTFLLNIFAAIARRMISQ